VEPIEGLEGMEPSRNAAEAWRPWQMEELELVEARDISTPRLRHFSNNYLLLVALHSCGRQRLSKGTHE
jgi:hypothetical protein